MSEKGERRVWLVSELYHPEETSTGYFMTLTAEGLARRFAVRVLCSQPTYEGRGRRAKKNEVRNGVLIHRCWSSHFSKDQLLGRWVNVVTISLSTFVNALARFRRRDCVLVVTNPPTLPFLMAAACRLRRADCVLIIHDVYPDVLVAAGMASPRSMAIRFLSWRTRVLYRRMARIVVLGRDMKRLVQRRLPSGGDRVFIIPNWGDVDGIQPRPRSASSLLQDWGLAGRFVLQYGGNMGRVHDLESLVECAARLRGREQIHFLFIGSGAKKEWLREEAAKRRLAQVTVLDHLPRAASNDFLNACDVALLSLNRGMAGISVPSRLYNVMAAGRPVIALADPDSELAQVVSEEGIGWVVPPGDVDRLQEAILDAAAGGDRLRQMGALARQAATGKYSMARAIRSYQAVVEGVRQQG